MDPQALYVQLSELAQSWPSNLQAGELNADAFRWLGGVAVLVVATGDIADSVGVKHSGDVIASALVKDLPLLTRSRVRQRAE